ncbi:HAMP domain-containing sensor histidine kinase [Haloarchaeobius sp. FL176]|uniref:sensor histidine kinase n=1 Tax=Haloarchaeobius sp. FL176 TaxID=2967129 RepID=UPI002147CCA2|nr:ATP-binding protein [Haloarchaeobius sp. FL176]
MSARLDPETARRRLYEIMGSDDPLDDRIRRALVLGSRFLAVENGHFTSIDASDDYWRAAVSTDPADGPFAAGTVIDLAQTYCRLAVDTDEQLVLSAASEQGMADDPAYREHELECYLGTPVRVDGSTVGTVCFVSHERHEAFDAVETMFAELLARTIERELEHQHAEDRMARLDEFAGVLSHDLRNPLNVAQGCLESVKETGDPDDFEGVAAALDRMEALITDALTVAREGRPVTDYEAVPLDTVVRDCWRMVDTADATLVMESRRTVRADASRLQRLLENLVRNALQHGGSEVTVVVGDLPEGFYVADDGPGIPPDRRAEVRESGFTTAEDGTGFGLSIVQSIAEAHGWSVEITESEEGGARFEFHGVDTVEAAE